jgi:hypothetical protein
MSDGHGIMRRSRYGLSPIPSGVRHQNTGDDWACFITEDLAHLGLMLIRFALTVKAAVFLVIVLILFLLSMMVVSRPK